MSHESPVNGGGQIPCQSRHPCRPREDRICLRALITSDATARTLSAGNADTNDGVGGLTYRPCQHLPICTDGYGGLKQLQAPWPQLENSMRDQGALFEREISCALCWKVNCKHRDTASAYCPGIPLHPTLRCLQQLSLRPGCGSCARQTWHDRQLTRLARRGLERCRVLSKRHPAAAAQQLSRNPCAPALLSLLTAGRFRPSQPVGSDAP